MRKIKRVYEPAEKSDGFRILVDRLWPRGVSKEQAKIDLWAKDAAPSAALRQWFHEDPAPRFKEFERKYRAELKKNASAIQSLLTSHSKQVTLVTAVKDIEHSHIPTLRKFLETLHD